MPKRYQIWDKKSDIFTPGRTNADHKLFPNKDHWTAEEYIQQMASWAGNPNMLAVVNTGVNEGRAICGIFNNFDSFKRAYIQMGLVLDDNMTPDEVLEAIEAFEDNFQPEQPITPEERIAAALEFANLVEHGRVTADIVKLNFQRGTWDTEMVAKAVDFNEITEQEFRDILSTEV